MPSVMLHLISVLSHVTILLFVILVAILSFWTSQRVRKASSKSPFDYFAPVSEHSKDELSRRHSEKLSTGSFPFPPIVKRSMSQGSAQLVTSEKQPRSSGSYGWRTPPLRQARSYSISPSCVSDRDDAKSESSGYTWDGQNSEFGYWLSDGEDANSPTGSLLDEGEDGMLPPSAKDILHRRATSGRRIIAAIGLLRAILGVPALLHYSRIGFESVPEALLSNFDLLVCDIALATGLAVAPVLLCLLSLSLELPTSWEHHVYHTSMILAALPLIAGLQLSESPELSLFRLAAPVFSVVAFLIARDQALVTYWSPLAARQGNHPGWL